jgi:hypothetical protein
MFIPFCILGEDNSQMFIASRKRDTFAIKRKFDVVYVTGIGEKQDFCFFGIE